MKMSRLLAAFGLLLFAVCANAVPAKRGIYQTIRLADGTELDAELCGDEFLSYWLAADGNKYVKSDRLATYQLADMTALKEKADQLRASSQTRVNAAMAKAPQRVALGGDHIVYEGSQRGLLILVEFSDVKFRDGHDVALYNDILNKDDFTSELGFRGSVRDYFRDQSYGKFLLNFDIVGPIQLPNNAAYYGGNDSSSRFPKAKNMGEFVLETLKAADATVDYTKYDWDGDGEVDQVFFLYAGRGEASGGGEDTIWPHESTVPSVSGQYLTLDGMRLNTYACGCEMATDDRIDGIGTICHEFSHCLGFPDMYDTENSSSGNYGMCLWSVMDQGSYLGNSYCPAEFCGWERVYAGWKEPIELTSNAQITGMKSISEDGDVYIVRHDANANEYYILENRQRTGWDSSQYGAGLLVTHVDFVSSIWSNNKVNASSLGHPHCTPIPADNNYTFTPAGCTGDVYPYRTNNALTNQSTPAATTYAKSTDGTNFMNKPITDIAIAEDLTVSFNFAVLDTRVLFYESFDNCVGKGGNDGVFNKIGSNSNVGQAAFSPDLTGWQCDSKGGANCCAMCSAPITTPEFELMGNAILTFMAAPLSGSGADATKLTLSGTGDIAFEQSSLTMESGKWNEFSVNISGQGVVTITFTPGTVFFLDEVKVKNNGSTGIESIRIPSASKSGEPDRIYSIDGRYVGTDLDALGKGIYIVGGKKVAR